MSMASASTPADLAEVMTHHVVGAFTEDANIDFKLDA
jgi:hypothetical protein